MRAILAAFALAGCAANGGFVAPSDMTPPERCENLIILAAFLDGADPGSWAARQAYEESDAYCSAIPG